MDAVAKSINHAIVVWVAHPTETTALMVLLSHRCHGGDLELKWVGLGWVEWG